MGTRNERQTDAFVSPFFGRVLANAESGECIVAFLRVCRGFTIALSVWNETVATADRRASE